jgi:hypothetical protein
MVSTEALQIEAVMHMVTRVDNGEAIEEVCREANILPAFIKATLLIRDDAESRAERYLDGLKEAHAIFKRGGNRVGMNSVIEKVLSEVK